MLVLQLRDDLSPLRRREERDGLYCGGINSNFIPRNATNRLVTNAVLQRQ